MNYQSVLPSFKMKSFASFTSFFCFIISASLMGQIDGEPLMLKTQTGNIYGTALIPKSNDQIPVALIIAGSGPTDRNGNNPMMTNNSLKMFAEGLYQRNIASLRFDKRGIGESKGSGILESELRFDDFINDVVLWVDLLKMDSRFSEVIVIGHSEGSLIGMVAAQNTKVAKFISIAGAGFPASEVIRTQLKDQPKFVTEQALPILEKLEQSETLDSVPQMLQLLFRPSVQPYLISWFAYNPQEEISKLRCPVLLVQGTTDIQISVKDAEVLLKSNTNAEKLIIDGMNHILKSSELDRAKNIETYSNPDLPLIDGLMEEVANFIKES